LLFWSEALRPTKYQKTDYEENLLGLSLKRAGLLNSVFIEWRILSCQVANLAYKKFPPFTGG
jgi:hypothetical protein